MEIIMTNYMSIKKLLDEAIFELHMITEASLVKDIDHAFTRLHRIREDSHGIVLASKATNDAELDDIEKINKMIGQTIDEAVETGKRLAPIVFVMDIEDYREYLDVLQATI